MKISGVTPVVSPSLRAATVAIGDSLQSVTCVFGISLLLMPQSRQRTMGSTCTLSMVYVLGGAFPHRTLCLPRLHLVELLYRITLDTCTGSLITPLHGHRPILQMGTVTEPASWRQYTRRTRIWTLEPGTLGFNSQLCLSSCGASYFITIHLSFSQRNKYSSNSIHC